LTEVPEAHVRLMRKDKLLYCHAVFCLEVPDKWEKIPVVEYQVGQILPSFAHFQFL